MAFRNLLLPSSEFGYSVQPVFWSVELSHRWIIPDFAVWTYGRSLETESSRFDSASFLVYLVFVGSAILVRISAGHLLVPITLEVNTIAFGTSNICPSSPCSCHGSWNRGRSPSRCARVGINFDNPSPLLPGRENGGKLEKIPSSDVIRRRVIRPPYRRFMLRLISTKLAILHLRLTRCRASTL